MLKHITNLATISVMAGSVVTLFLVALSAMLTGGKIILDFNSLNEGWFEVCFLGLFIIPVLNYITKDVKTSSLDYYIRSETK